MTTAAAVDDFLASQGIPRRVTAAQAETYAHAYGYMYGGGKAMRSPFRHRHPRVTLPRMELAAYLARRTVTP
jgi:hypothetical protein